MSSLEDAKVLIARAKCAEALRKYAHLQYTGGGGTDFNGKYCALAFIGAIMNGKVQSLGLDGNQLLEIIDMNDIQKLTFPEIADALERM